MYYKYLYKYNRPDNLGISSLQHNYEIYSIYIPCFLLEPQNLIIDTRYLFPFSNYLLNMYFLIVSITI